MVLPTLQYTIVLTTDDCIESLDNKVYDGASELPLVRISRLTIVSSMRLIRSTLVYSRLGSFERIRDVVFDTRK